MLILEVPFYHILSHGIHKIVGELYIHPALFRISWTRDKLLTEISRSSVTSKMSQDETGIDHAVVDHRVCLLFRFLEPRDGFNQIDTSISM